MEIFKDLWVLDVDGGVWHEVISLARQVCNSPQDSIMLLCIC